MKPCLIGLIVLCAVFSGTGIISATITVLTSATVALTNDSTFFNCSTTSEEVEWLFSSEQYPQLIVYSYGAIHPRYMDRFRVQNYSNTTNSFENQFNLIIQSVAKDDAGRYICRDPYRPNEEGKEMHLIVLETQPICKSNLNVSELIGPNSCGIKPETVQLSCSIRYIGDQLPELQWIKSGENIAIDSSMCSHSGNIYTCNLTMESELQMEGSSYVCQMTQSVTKQYNCTSDVFRIIYVLGEQTELTRAVNDRVNCSFNSSSQACTSSWIFDNGTTNWTESLERVIEFKRPGRYICEANCVIRNNNCTLTTVTVYVTVNAEPQVDDTAIVGIIAPIVVVVVVVFIVICVIAYMWNRDRQNVQSNSTQAEQMLLNAVHDEGDNILRTITSQTDGNREKRVRGLAILNDELFVAFEMSDIIQIFPIQTSASNRLSQVANLKDPGAMAACAKNNCLYIVDQKRNNSRKEILRFKPNGTVINTWATDDDDRGRISVNSEGNVIMTAYNKQKVKIYTPDGTLLTEKTIDFSGTHITLTFHTVNLADGNFIISHGTYKSDIHQVCKFDTTGKIVRSFGNEKGSGDAQLNCPAYVAERKDGSILVADQENHRIILLNSELEFRTVLFTKENDRVSRPETMYVYEKNEPALLFLGCNETSNSGGYLLVLRLGQ